MAARRWYWRQAIGLALRFATSRLVPSMRPRRRWAIADIGHDDHSRWAWLTDGRYALRALRHRPGLSGAIVVTLALALAANAAIFTLADALYLRPFRFTGVDRLRRGRLRAGERSARGSFVGRPGRLPRLDPREHDAHRLCRRGFLGPESLGGGSAGAARGLSRHPGILSSAEDRAALRPHVPGRRSQPRPRSKGGAVARPLDAALRCRPEPRRPHHPPQRRAARGRGRDATRAVRPVWRRGLGAARPTPRASGSSAGRGCLLVLARLAGDQSIDSARAEMNAIAARQRQRFPDTHALRQVSVVSFTRGLSDAGAGPFLAIWQAAAALLLLDRVREHREPADGAGNRAAARVRRSTGARRAALAAGPPGADRRRVAGGVLPRAGPAARGARRRGAPSRIACERAAVGGRLRVPAGGPHGAADDGAARRGCHPLLLAAAGPAGIRRRRLRYAAARRTHGHGRPRPAMAGDGSGRRASGPDPGSHRRVGPHRGRGGRRRQWRARLRQAARDDGPPDAAGPALRRAGAPPPVRRPRARPATRHPGGGIARCGQLPAVRGDEFEPPDLPRGGAADARRGPAGGLSASLARLLRHHAYSPARRPRSHRRRSGRWPRGGRGQPQLRRPVLARPVADRAAIQDRRG